MLVLYGKRRGEKQQLAIPSLCDVFVKTMFSNNASRLIHMFNGVFKQPTSPSPTGWLLVRNEIRIPFQTEDISRNAIVF